ncbi:replication protein A 70 kDa DNA-binding subunit B [Trifolium repens]|nr:replication protein A 70 kDa DNA-binding subunit B [Trifolium repens]
MLDAIGHVVEKNVARETEKNGKRSKVMDVTLEDLEMNIANVELTQVVSQVSGPVVLSVADDLLQTPRMTIEDLIESIEKCVGFMLAVACEIDTDLSWFYQAGSRCASRIKYIGGQLYCDKCKMPRTAIPRFKVDLQVIDDTGSITFVMFDRIVSQVLGRTAQDLLDAMNNVHPIIPYTLMSGDVCDGADYTQFACDLDGDASFEGGGSTNHEESIASKAIGKKGSNVDGVLSSTIKGSSPPTVELVGADISQISPLKQATSTTPTSKISGKKAYNVGIIGASPPKTPSPSTRSMVSTEIGHVSPPKQAGKRSANIDQGEIVATKDTKMPCVKIEPLE